MAMKRKHIEDASVHVHSSAKQMKLVPFPSSEGNFDSDMDVAMSDESIMDVKMPTTFHSRLPSSASTDTDYSSDASTSAYPTFDLYPASEPSSRTSSIAGRTFSGLGFPHLRVGCKQLPKLRVACGAGPGGQRSMWGLCEECGAIQILDS